MQQDMMRAVVLNGCCSAAQLQPTLVPIPQTRPGWVLVRIHAAGLNHSEAILRLHEADCDYIHTPIIPGIECVGEVADASDSTLHQGDRVIALMGGMGRSFNGSYAQYALLPASNVFRVDTDLNWLSLAAIPETYYTAYGALRDGLMLHADDVLLIRGATSTVGQAAIQLATAMGATVIATSRRASAHSLLHDIGASFCMVDDGALSQQSWQVRPNKVLELIGPRTLSDSMLSVSRPGFVCSTGILGNVYTVQQFDPIKDIPNGVFLSGFYSNYPTQEVIDDLMLLIHDHALRPLYSHIFPLDDIATAHTLLEQGGAGGKIILQID